MLATKIEDAKREEGFTLIELLVVVIIIGILAAIAIPIFLNQRESAWEGSVESDIRNAAIEVETAATRDRGSYPDNGEVVARTNVETSADVTLNYTVGAENASFVICGTHANIDDYIEYDSAEGGLADEVWQSGTCSGTNMDP